MHTYGSIGAALAIPRVPTAFTSHPVGPVLRLHRQAKALALVHTTDHISFGQPA
jgi:hypothetical protein